MLSDILWPRQASLIVISDAHLKSTSDQYGVLLKELLKSLPAAKPDCLVLLGDIFDFTLGSNRFFREKFQEVGKLLTAIHAAGTRIIFLEGNHEFDMARHGWSGVECFSERLYPLMLRRGERVLLSHGDGICAPRRYHIFRRIVRSPL